MKKLTLGLVVVGSAAGVGAIGALALWAAKKLEVKKLHDQKFEPAEVTPEEPETNDDEDDGLEVFEDIEEIIEYPSIYTQDTQTMLPKLTDDSQVPMQIQVKYENILEGAMYYAPEGILYVHPDFVKALGWKWANAYCDWLQIGRVNDLVTLLELYKEFWLEYQLNSLVGKSNRTKRREIRRLINFFDTMII